MSDEKDKKLTHGFDIHAGEHQHALDFMAENMSKKQVEDMVIRAEGKHRAEFMVTNHEGKHSNYILTKEDGKLRIHSDYSH